MTQDKNANEQPKAHLISKISEDIDERHIEKAYDFYAHDLSVAFAILRKLTENEGLDSSVLTMQKYPTLSKSKKKTRKKDSEGNPVEVEKVTEVVSDTRWVLSFDWKTRDPAEARSLSYDFYDNGWPCRIEFMLADDEDSPVFDDGELAFPDKDIRRFEMTMITPDASRADRLDLALMELVEGE